MKGIQKKFKYFFILCLIPLVSCVSNLEPLPDEINDLSMSWSLPIGVAEVGLDGAYYIGLPNINLAEDVPEWAKYDTIYYSDSIPVDLSRIYEKSSTITYLAFKINIWNEFPAGCTVQTYFVDSSSTPIYLFPNNNPLKITKGDIFADGKVFHPSYSGTTVTFNQAQIEQLRAVESLIFLVKVGLNKAPVWSFQYFDNFKLTCQVGARVDFVLNNP